MMNKDEYIANQGTLQASNYQHSNDRLLYHLSSELRVAPEIRHRR